MTHPPFASSMMLLYTSFTALQRFPCIRREYCVGAAGMTWNFFSLINISNSRYQPTISGWALPLFPAQMYSIWLM